MIAIIDYNMGNVRSVKNALTALGYDCVISRKKKDLENASHLILPGVGAFVDGTKNLDNLGLVKILNDQVLIKHKPILGICLGMQMMAETGEEGKLSRGLGWIQGIVRRFNVDEKKYPIPHVGWNDVVPSAGSALFKNIEKNIFYFVHSYFLVPENKKLAAGLTDYGEKFTSAVQSKNVFGVQFHPEKSQQAGLKVLDNFLHYE